MSRYCARTSSGFRSMRIDAVMWIVSAISEAYGNGIQRSNLVPTDGPDDLLHTLLDSSALGFGGDVDAGRGAIVDRDPQTDLGGVRNFAPLVALRVDEGRAQGFFGHLDARSPLGHRLDGRFHAG